MLTAFVLEQGMAMHYAGSSFLPYAEGLDPFIELFEGTPSRLFYEPQTGHLAFDPMPTKSHLRSFYEGTYAEAVPLPDPQVVFTSELVGVCDGVLSYASDFGGLSDSPSVHEFGCGMGGAVWGFQQLGLRATGSDENLRSWVKAGSPQCDGKLSSKTLQQALSKVEGEIDFFFSSHSLNLVPDPVGALAAMSERLSDAGIVYINVPNGWSDRLAKIGRRSGDDFNFPIHLHSFTPSSLRWMLALVDLEIVNVESRPLHELSSRGGKSTADGVDHLHRGELHVLATRPTNLKSRRLSNVNELIDRAGVRFKTAQLKEARSHAQQSP